MNIASLFSGGKDSVLALYKVLQEGHEVKTLITLSAENPESYMFHVPNIKLTPLQAEAIEIPIIFKTTKGLKEEELKDLKRAVEESIMEYDIKGVVSGAIFSNYQKSRIDNICRELNIKSIAPLWQKKPEEMLEEMISSGFKIIMSAVAAGGLGPDWLGKELNDATIKQLLNLHDVCYVCTAGEGGEFETFVLDAPFFKRKIEIIVAEKIWDGQSGVYNIKKAVLIDK